MSAKAVPVPCAVLVDEDEASASDGLEGGDRTTKLARPCLELETLLGEASAARPPRDFDGDSMSGDSNLVPLEASQHGHRQTSAFNDDHRGYRSPLVDARYMCGINERVHQLQVKRVVASRPPWPDGGSGVQAAENGPDITILRPRQVTVKASRKVERLKAPPNRRTTLFLRKEGYVERDRLNVVADAEPAPEGIESGLLHPGSVKPRRG